MLAAVPRGLAGFVLKDFKLLFKKKKYLYLSLLLPLIIGFIYLSMIDTSNTQIDLMVCDFDSTQMTRQVFESIEGFDITYNNTSGCVDDMVQGIKDRDYLFGAVIKEGFSDRLAGLQQGLIEIYYDNSDPAISSLAAWKFDLALEPFRTELSNQFAQQLQRDAGSAREKVSIALDLMDDRGAGGFRVVEEPLEKAESDLLTLEQLDKGFVSKPIVVSNKGVYEEKTITESGFAPLFGVLNLFLILMLCSTGVIYDRRTKTLTRIRASRNSMLTYIFGKLIVFFAITIAEFAVLLGLFVAFGASFSIAPVVLLKALLFTSLVNTLIGVLIGFVSDSEGVAVLISLIITLPLLFLSGMFYPLELMPQVIQWLAHLMPLSTEVFMLKKAVLFGGEIAKNYFFAPLGVLIVTWFLSSRVR